MDEKTVSLQNSTTGIVPPNIPECFYMLGFSRNNASDLFLSRNTKEALHSDVYVDDWISERLSSPRLTVKPTTLKTMTRWQIDEATGNILHDSGKFFTITGIEVRHQTRSGEIEWDQPIIDQPEIGILGILAKRINGILHFCLQAKEEPGNLHSVQLSPTVQATFSNYTRVHGGNSPPLLEFFIDPPKDRIIFAKLQTEDGGRFLFKSNRNMIVQICDDELSELPDGFLWLTLRQIALLIRRNNLIHACTRSILSALPLGPSPLVIDTGTRAAPSGVSLHDSVQWLNDQRAANHIYVKHKGLNTLLEWGMDQDGYFSHKEGRFFRVIGINVSSDEREVTTWSQPILDNPEPGIIGLLTKVVNHKRFYLMQAKSEPGNRSIIQLGPTVQFTTINYVGNPKIEKPFLFEMFTGSNDYLLVSESFQAEEGARFFQEDHLHRIIEIPAETEIKIPPDFRWLSEDEISFFLHLGESVNSCARSIFACLL